MPSNTLVRLLLLNDDPVRERLLTQLFRSNGFDVVTDSSPETAQRRWNQETFHLMMVDLSARGRSLTEICLELRSQITNPILLLVDSESESEVLASYKAGVDDCIPRSTNPSLLAAKLKAWARWSWVLPSEALPTIRAGQWTLEPGQRCLVVADNSVVPLTNLEFRLLHLMMTNQSRLLENEELVERVWGYCGEGDSGRLRNLIYRLRHKLEPNPGRPSYILTVGSIGYRFQGN